MTDLGSFGLHEGRPSVRFRRSYRHSAERVWRALTDPGELASWFPTAVTVDPRPGGAITFAGDPHAPAATGTILIWEPPRRLAFTWYDDELHFALDEVDAGCVLTLVDVLADRSTAARTAGGWYVCLGELRKVLDGEPSGGPHSADAAPWAPVYQAHLDAGLPAGAPVPDIAPRS